MARVVLAVEGGVVSEGLRDLLTASGCRIVATLTPGDLTVDEVASYAPDVVVLDCEGARGERLVAACRTAAPAVTVIAISVDEPSMAVFRADDTGPPSRFPLSDRSLVAAALHR